MPATIADVARKVGKSYQLVSAVLNGGKSSSAASEQTRERILSVAHQLNYRPNTAAKAVVTGKFNAIGLMLSVASWRSTLPTDMLTGIHQSLARHDFHLIVNGFPDETLVDDSKLPSIFSRMMVDGLLVKYDCYQPSEMVEKLSGLRLPLVWINSKHARDCVNPDDVRAGREATEHLLRLGHRKILFVSCVVRGPEDHHSIDDRMAGYRQAMQSSGCRVVQCVENIPAEDRCEWLARLLGKHRPSAVVACNSSDALPLYVAAERMGLRVPRQLSIITFGADVSVFSGLPLTGYAWPEGQVGERAVEMLIQKIHKPRVKCEPVFVPFTLIEGATCASPFESH